MRFAKERIEVICANLKAQMFTHCQPLEDWQIKPGKYLTPGEAANAAEPWTEFNSAKDHWYGPDRYYWFVRRFIVPEALDGKPLYLLVRTQIDEWDDGKNPQMLLFVNGEPVQGLDMNHREVLLCPCAKGGEEYDLQLQAYTGTLHSEFRLLVDAGALIPEVAGLYYDLQVPLWGIQRMEADSKTRLDILTALNDAINLLDFRSLYSDDYFKGIQAALEHLKVHLYDALGGQNEFVASCVGHTHIDVAWWWTVEETRSKVARSFATVLKLMEEYPEYKFMSSQPQLYLFLKQRYPALYERVKQRIAEGRWEAEGGMWLEADCNLTSGESLVRQFLFGQRFFREEFGVENKILWLPDVFGYSGALPQICKKSGIDYFMTTKLSWNQFNMIPSDTLWWRGIDGSEIFTHFITTLGVGQSTERFMTTYNGILHPDALMGAWERYQNKALDNDLLIAYGFGDGGGGPTREMLETGRRLESGIKGMPRVRQASARQYYDELIARVGNDKRLPTWVGEFYFEYHRGTYTSMARNKRANRKSELMLMDLELTGVLAEEKGIAYPAEELEQLWKVVLLNQFHDILPGSSIREVYEVTQTEYTEVERLGNELLGERLQALAGKGNEIAVFNTTGFARDDLLVLKGEVPGELRDVQGTRFTVQRIEGGGIVYLRGLPSKGWRSFVPAEGIEVSSPFVTDEYSIETPFYSIRFDEDGCFTQLWDKRARREVLQPGMRGNLLRMYEDKPIYFDNWDIDIFYNEKNWDLGESKIQWTETGPVRATLRVEREFCHSKMVQDIHFYAESPRIDFDTWVDWHESQHLLKVLFPLELNTDEATFDIQFGNVVRKTHKNTSWEQARFESCAHKWVDVSEHGYGVAILNDCKYGHSVEDNVVGLTLIKSGIEPNPVTDQEEHRFTYALLPHMGGWREAGVVQEGYKLNQPLAAVQNAASGQYSYVTVDADNVVLETVKKAEKGDGHILRLYESHNQRTDATLCFAQAPSAVWSCDLMENKVERLETEGNLLSLIARPYEIITLLVEY